MEGLITEKLKNFSRSLKRHLVESFIIVKKLDDPEIAKMRFDICLGCKYLRKEDLKCRKCKCYMDMKSKTEINEDITVFPPTQEITHCPEGFWGDADIANIYRRKKGLELIQTNNKNLIENGQT